MDVWIKIMEQKQRFMLRSHSSWMRGLKLPFLYWDKSCKNRRTLHAFTGAWIKIHQ